MAHVDVTVVSVAQRTFVASGPPCAVVAWTMTAASQATVIPTSWLAADRSLAPGGFSRFGIGVHPRLTVARSKHQTS